MTSFCSEAIAMANGSDFLSVTSWMSRLSRSAFVLVCCCCCCWSSGSTGTYGVNVGGKIFSCLEGRWWNVDARRLMNPQVKQQWKQLWPDFERAGKKQKKQSSQGRRIWKFRQQYVLLSLGFLSLSLFPLLFQNCFSLLLRRLLLSV